ncbi:fumarate hydratase [Salipiger aestuarii]|uniref:Fumarate hydratase class I n=2 Tax=Salipiger aestuarii TaxID=568098 RepID=A0A327XTC2_9RHOB|nr:fumarate hydratase [Salipiger aestuarii]KAB2539803.1 fumarate hydratase [Salipiger aestuarii]RAK12013.1 homodimeric fumarase (class I) [Salipiger aestuarii]
MSIIKGEDITETIRAVLQYIAVYHAPDYLGRLAEAYRREQSPAARDAMGQILQSARMAAIGHRPVCQDTGMVTVFARLGQMATISGSRTLEECINDGVRLAYLDAGNPLRASIVADPIFARRNTRDNTPAVTHVQSVAGAGLELMVAAKGGGSENKARYAMLTPAAPVADWVVDTVAGLGAGWCPPGVISVGVGGSAEMAMLLAKRALMDEIDMHHLLDRGPQSPEEDLRIELYQRINDLGIGAQGLGGQTTVVDVKVSSYPTHAASKPVALMPQCAANRHAKVTLTGAGPVYLDPPDLDLWPVIDAAPDAALRRVDVDTLTRADMTGWRAGETLLLSGRILTGRDAAHRRIAEILARGEPLPFSLQGRVIYYVGPVDPVGDEAVGPAGPTTASRMDGYTQMMLDQGLLSMIGKAERGPGTVDRIAAAGATYLIAVGGAAVLVSRAIQSARMVAFEDLGMEAVREFHIRDMPVTVAVDGAGQSIHRLGPARWRRGP